MPLEPETDRAKDGHGSWPGDAGSDSASSLSKYLRSAGVTGVVKSAGSAAAVLMLLPVIINQIGMEQYGTWAILPMFVGFSGLAGLGLSGSASHYLAQCQNNRERSKFLSALLLPYAILMLIAGFVGLWFFLSGASLFPERVSISGQVNQALIACGTVIFCVSLSNQLFLSVLDGLFRQHLVNGFHLASSLATYGGLLIIAFIRPVTETLLLGTTAIQALLSLVPIVLVRWVFPFDLHWPRWHTVRQLLTYGVRIFSVGLVNNVMNPSNRYLLLYVSGVAAILGVFNIALRLTHLARSFLNAFSVPLFSVFSRFGRSDLGKIRALLDMYLIRLAAVHLLGVALFYSVGEDILCRITLSRHTNPPVCPKS